MSARELSAQRQERLTKLALIGVFTGLLAAFAPARKSQTATRVSSLDFAMLGLATFRLGRLTAYDEVAEPLREPFAETIDDPSGAGQTTTSLGKGSRKVIGDLMTCPICAGTWAGAALVYGLRIAPGPTRLVMAIFSAAGVAELLNSAVEAMEWTAQLNREKVGDS